MGEEENGTSPTTGQTQEEEEEGIIQQQQQNIKDDNIKLLLPRNELSNTDEHDTEVSQQGRAADGDMSVTNSGDIPPTKDLEDQQQIEIIDIDEFLIRGNECGRCQIWIVFQMMLVTFTLAYTPFIFYFIGFDPHWTRTGSDIVHLREDNARCYLNDSQWEYDYEKTTVVTEVN